MKTLFVLGLAPVFGAIASLPLAPTALAQDPFPEAPGRATVFLACSQCHSIGKMVQADLTPDDWRFVVYDMIARGAPVPADDVDTVIRYLQNNFARDGS